MTSAPTTAGRVPFAHEAVLEVTAGGDLGAPGGAITLALCGRWDHEPPCPLAAHFTSAEHDGGEVTVRLLFATAPDDEARVRRLVEDALAAGWGDDPDGVRTTWRLLRSGPSDLRPDEEEHAGRLAG